MALFKIFRGPEKGLNNVPCHEGYAYFTEDLGNLFIDISDTPGSRVQVNAQYAEGLRSIADDGTITDIEVDDLLLKNATIDVANGGTGQDNLTLNALIVGNGTDAVKMVSIAAGDVVIGDATSGVKGINGVGAFHALTAGAPSFGTLPIAAGGTGATTDAAARDNLGVFGKTEVNEKVATATSTAWSTTLLVNGWTESGDNFIYNYINTDITCGASGTVPPIITYTSNLEDYSKISSAEATKGAGIVFTISEKPSADIGIIITDIK